MDFDCVIVGAGFAGSVLAERLANKLDKKVLVVEKRNHIGGNCYDYYNEEGILVHKYGPHIFHTNDKEVWDYLSRFTEWNNYKHKVLAFIDGKEVPLPFNLTSIEMLFPKDVASRLIEKLINTFGKGAKIPIFKLLSEEDKDLKFIGNYIYEKVFLNYTLKQWGLKPEELNPSVASRVPILISREDYYFSDEYQGLPKNGYTFLFKKLLSNKNIKLLLNTDAREVLQVDSASGEVFLFGKPFAGEIIWTGPVDEFFGYKYGELPYRSLNFEFETFNYPYCQKVAVVNYPNDYDFTRITEFKHMTFQESNKTTIIKEYPKEYIKDKNLPYYPIIKDENIELYNKYKQEINNLNNRQEAVRFYFVGRLAEYKYYNMDAVVKKALNLFGEIREVEK